MPATSNNSHRSADREAEQRRLDRLRLLDVLDTAPEPIFDGIARLAGELCGTSMALVSLIDTDRQWCKSSFGLAGDGPVPRHLAFCSHAIDQPGGMEVPDTLEDARFCDHPMVTGSMAIRFYAGAPIAMHGGEAVGTVCVMDKRPRQLDDAQRMALAGLAAMARDALLMREELQNAARAPNAAERKASEDKLRSTNRFLEKAGQVSGVGAWDADLRSQKVTWTDQNARIYDLPAGYQPGFNEHLKYFEPTSRSRIVEAAQRAFVERKPWDLELQMITAMGRHIWVRSMGEVECSDDGTPVRLVGAMHDITAQKNSAAELRRANKLLQSVIDNLPCGLSVFNADQHLVAWNRQFQDLLQFPDELMHALPVTFESLIRYNAMRGEYGDVDAEEYVCSRVEAARRPAAHAMQRTRPNGQVLDIHGMPLPDGGWVSTYLDITEANGIERALRTSEERQKRALDSSRLVLWDLDLVRGQAYLSENWSVLMGGPAVPTIMSADDLQRLVLDEDQLRVAKELQRALKVPGHRYEVEHRVRRPDGTVIWLHSLGEVTTRGPDGQALHATGTNQNITERKLAEATLASTAAVTEATLESTTDGILVVDASRNVLYYNSRLLVLWGFTPAERLTTSDQMIEQGLPLLRDPQGFVERLRELYAQGSSTSHDQIELKDGRVLERYGQAMHVGQIVTGRVWSYRDVTAQHATQEAMRQARDAAEAANQAKSDFLATVSHEIRTPLNGVLGLIELMKGTTVAPDQAQYLELAEASGRQLMMLINDLLDLGKIEAGHFELEDTDFSLHALIDMTCRSFASRADASGLLFRSRVGHRVPDTVRGDPTRLRQVLDNLLGNAIKFTARGEVGLDLDLIRQDADTVTLELRISDTGIGISQEDQGRLFARFSQANASTTRKYGGTGLGLAIVKQICERMDGNILVQSAAGQGATFVCTLKLQTANVADAAPPREVDLQVQHSPDHTRLLVVEDDPTNLVVLRGLLRRLGYARVDHAGDGMNALNLVAIHSYDVIFMDCRMPVMDGYETTRRLRQRGYDRPIVAVTANASTSEREQCLHAGMTEYLSKPISVRKLAAILEAQMATNNPTAGPAETFGTGVTASAFDPRQKDLVDAIERLEADMDLYRQVLETFRKDVPRTLEACQQALTAGNRETARRHLHSIKGAASTVGASQVVSAAESIMDILDAASNLPQEVVLEGIRYAHLDFLDFVDRQWSSQA